MRRSTVHLREVALALAIAGAVLARPTATLAAELTRDVTLPSSASAFVANEGAISTNAETGSADAADLALGDDATSVSASGAGSPAQPATGWVERDGARYYLGEGGEPRTGWLLDAGSWYWLDPSTGAMATGWVATGGAWYWLDPATGAMAAGRAECGGAWSDFSASGAWLGYSSGWDLRDGSWHWLEGGRRAAGWRRVGGSWYWMDDDGDMATGWASVGGRRYHLSASGAMDAGWLLDGGRWYWLDPSGGDLRTGWLLLGGRWYWADPSTGACAQDEAVAVGSASYAFDSSCAMGEGGWCLAGGRWYWAEAGGGLASGWRLAGGSWYWMDPLTRAMRTGLLQLGGARYYLTASGAMATGWAWDASEGCWYYATPSNNDGRLLTGWQLVGGRWYWMDSATARMQTGWLTVGGKTYHLSASGAMDTSCWIDSSNGESSWINSDGVLSATVSGDAIKLADGLTPDDGLTKVGDAWFYLVEGKIQHGSVTIDGVAHLFDETTGRAVTGWHVDADGVRRHYDEKGTVQTGWVRDGGWFYLDSEGAVTTGWKVIDGRWYHFDSSDGKMQTGWLLDNGHWYWFENSGAMATGWVWTGGAWYYMDADGSMHTGWLNLGGTWYYLSSSGAMQTGWIYDGSAYYFCAADGHWIPSNAEYRDMLNWAQGYSSATNYLILVDTANCRVGIYYGRFGSWSVSKEFICSPGAPSTPTVKGQFTVQDKGYVFGHGYSCYYYTQFYNDYLFHSVLYNEGTRVVQDGRLGQHLSHGCVRLAIENAKWIYDNIPRGTKVVIW